jgi:hypothetical protein
LKCILVKTHVSLLLKMMVLKIWNNSKNQNQ